MKPRIKLLTLHTKELPSYVYDFAGRVRDISIVDWELVLYRDAQQINRLVTERLGTPCNKDSGYSLCDVRPMLAEIFPEKVKGYEWWGWVEIDTVLGDLDRLLPPLLDRYPHAISMFESTVSGPLMLLRNTPGCNILFKLGNWQWVLKEPTYCNFEEVMGAHVAGPSKGSGFSQLLEASGLRVKYDGRFSLRDDPNATCHFEGNRLIEVPSGREILIYHFNHTKLWPLLDGVSRYRDLHSRLLGVS